MRKIFLFILVFTFLSISSINSSPAQAQSCTGSYTNPDTWQCDPDGLGGRECVRRAGETSPCTYNYSLGRCDAALWVAESCTVTASGCFKQNRYDGQTTNGCSLVATPTPTPTTAPGTPAPTPTAPPGWGGCGSCSTCGVAGECVRAPDGACHWDPSSCGPSRPGAPTCWTSLSDPGPLTVGVTAYTTLTFSFGGTYNDGRNHCNVGAFGDGEWIDSMTSSNTSVATISFPWATFSNPCQVNPPSPQTRTIQINPISTGATAITAHVVVSGPGGGNTCSSTRNVSVLAPTTPPTPTPVPTATPLPSCTVSINPGTDPTTILSGETSQFVPVIQNCTNTTSYTHVWNINGVTAGIESEFVDSSGNSLGTGPLSDTLVEVLGLVSGGEDQLELTVTATGPGGTATFTDTVNYLMGAPGPWWQVFSGDILTGPAATVSSLIPSSCSIAEDSGLCRDELIVEDADGATPLGPGIVLARVTNFGATDSSANRADGTADDWVADTHYAGTAFNYAYFNTLISGKSNLYEPGSSVSIRDAISNATADVNGYKYIRASGNRSTGNIINVNANSKVIVLVEGNLTINNRISVNETNNGFLMIVAGGDITVDPTVRNVGINPAMEGVYFTDRIFSTGTNGVDDDPFTLRGMVAAMGGFNLQRDLVDENVDTPAEVFEYVPEFSYNFPTSMSQKHLFTREVIP